MAELAAIWYGTDNMPKDLEPFRKVLWEAQPLFRSDHKKFSAPFGKLHHKIMVIDDTIAGSMDLTKPGNIYNYKNVLIIESLNPMFQSKKADPQAA